MLGGPEEIDVNNPETWVKEDPERPGESVAVAVLLAAAEGEDQS